MNGAREAIVAAGLSPDVERELLKACDELEGARAKFIDAERRLEASAAKFDRARLVYERAMVGVSAAHHFHTAEGENDNARRVH